MEQITNFYRNIQPLNVGSYGEIFVAQHCETGREVVLKKIAKRGEPHRIKSEIEAGIMFKDFPGVASFHEYFETTFHYVSRDFFS
jgi:hypothetical protein